MDDCKAFTESETSYKCIHTYTYINRHVTQPAARRVFSAEVPKEAPKGWWHSAQFWGGLGAVAGWGMTGSAIYDAS